MRSTPWRRLWALAALAGGVVPTIAGFAESAATAAPPVVPTVSVSDATVVEGDAGESTLQFDVTLSEPTTATVTMDVTSGDGTATILDNDYQTVSLALTFVAGSVGPAHIVVPVNGDTHIEPDETLVFSITNVVNATVADSDAVGTIVNDDEPAVVPEVSVSDATVVEGDAGESTLQFEVALSEPTTSTVTMHVATADGTATILDNDYQTVSLDLTFIAGAVGPAQILVPVNGDTQVEPDETLVFSITDVVNATIADSDAVGTIVNDDEPAVVPTVSVSDATVVEGDSGQSFLEFEVTLSSTSTDQVKVHVATGDGSATIVDNDYQTASINITFIAGATTATILVPVNGDTQIEPDENVHLIASNAENATIGDGTGLGTIDNDDAVVALDETAVSVIEGDSGTTDAVISGVLSTPLATDLDLPGTLTDGSATEGSDFESPVPATLHIPAGSTSGTLSVPVNGDTDIEPDETFTVSFELPAPPQPFRRVAGFASLVSVGGTLVAEVTIVNDDVVAPTTSTTTTTTVPGATTSTTTTTDPPTTTTATTATTTSSVPAGTLPATRWRS